MAWAQYGLEINSNSIDLLEVCGVLLARKGEKKEAIILMDRIIKINSRYVMAYTNKSIFLAELGQIEEAEKVKSLGIMASIEESISSEIKDDNSSRLRMFQEVLEIDLNDLNSNLELAKHYLDIDVIKTEKYLNNINIESAEKYLLLAQLNYRIGSIDKVKECLVSGMEVAKRSSQKNIISKIEKYSESINIY